MLSLNQIKKHICRVFSCIIKESWRTFSSESVVLENNSLNDINNKELINKQYKNRCLKGKRELKIRVWIKDKINLSDGTN